MSFLILISMAAGLSWALSRLFRRKLDLRGAMRWGMGLGFIFTGVDHFVSATQRYVPMIPDALAGHALFWVYLTGLGELLGGLGLLIPLALYRRMGWPDLRRQAGLGLAMLLVCVVTANVHMALKGESVQGLEFGTWYLWLRPLIQPVFVIWALYCSGFWSRQEARHQKEASDVRRCA